MTQTIKIKRSSVQGKVPTTSDLQLGELAINTYDGNLYMLKNDGVPSVVNLTSDPAQFVFKTGSTMTGVLTASAGVVGNLTGNVTGNVTGSLSGNASTATILQTARMINGVPFDGSANITVADSTRVLKAGDTMTGTLVISGDGQMLRPTATSTAGIPGLRIQDSTNTRRVEILALGTAASTTYGVTAGNSVINVATGSLIFATTDTPRVTIDSSGKVGIGASSPELLTVAGAIAIPGTGALISATGPKFALDSFLAGTARLLSFGANTTTQGTFSFYQASSDNSIFRSAVTIDASGNVGITSTTPTEKLIVQGAIRSTSNSVSFSTGAEGAFMDFVAGTSVRMGHVSGASGSARSLLFYSGGNQVASIDTSGNLSSAGNMLPSPTYTNTVSTVGIAANTYLVAIPANTLPLGAYHVTIRWDHVASGVPFVVASAFTWMVVNTNNVADDLVFTAPTSTHRGSDGAQFSFRSYSSTSATSGLKVAMNYAGGDGSFTVSAFRFA